MKKIEIGKKVLIFTISMTLCTSALLFSYHVNAQQEKEYFFEIMITYTTRYTDGGIWEVVVDELEKIGIKAEIETIDFSTWIDKAGKVPSTYKEGGWDATTCNMGWSDPSGVSRVFGSLLRRPLGWNIMGYADGRVDDLFEQGVSTMDLDERQAIYEETWEIIIDDMPVAPLLWPIHPAPSHGIKWKEGYDVVFWDYPETWYSTEGDETISIAMGNDVTHQIPSLAREGGSNQFIALVFNSLVRLDKDNLTPVPELAESWEHSEDFMTWTFHLRDDVYWHDGEKLTSEDVVFTYETLGEPELGSLYSYLLNKVESIEAPDDYTVVINLNGVIADWWSGEQLPALGIAPKHLLENVPFEDWPTCDFSKTDTIGTGPYIFVDHKEGEYTQFAANPDYFLGEPAIKNIYFRVIPDKATALVAIETGEVHLLEYRGAAFTGEEVEHMKSIGLIVPQWPAFNLYGLYINVNHPNLSNKYVRHAIAHAIPREHICEDILGGTGIPANAPVPPGFLGHHADLPSIEYSIDEAKALMEMAGYKYEYITPKPTPMSAYLIPGVGGLVIGAVVASVATYIIAGKRRS